MAAATKPPSIPESIQAAPAPEQHSERSGPDLLRVFDWPALTWILLAFFIVFGFYFLKPTFLNSAHEIQFLLNFPVLNPIGADLHEYIGFTRALLQNGSPYIAPNYYPPLESVLFIPLTWTSPDRAYEWMIVINASVFFGLTLVFPLLLSKERRFSATLMFFLISGLFSYGFFFELERGQYDLIVMAFCFSALYLYHYQPRLHFLAYVLFVISVQIKIYPGIFLLLFATDWHAWKQNLRRWGLLLLANFAGLFVLGPKVFLDFVAALQKQLQVPTYISLVNHSITSFATLAIRKLGPSGDFTKPQLREFTTILQVALLLFILACLAAVIWTAYKRRLSPLNPYVLVVFTIGALVIPSTSHDYVFAAMIAPFAIFLNSLRLHRSGRLWADITSTLLVFLIALAYCATLFLHDNQPLALNNNLPALLLIALATTFLFFIRSPAEA
jgi:hypothetical protein